MILSSKILPLNLLFEYQHTYSEQFTASRSGLQTDMKLGRSLPRHSLLVSVRIKVTPTPKVKIAISLAIFHATWMIWLSLVFLQPKLSENSITKNWKIQNKNSITKNCKIQKKNSITKNCKIQKKNSITKNCKIQRKNSITKKWKIQ